MFFGLKRILNSKLLKYLALSLGIHAGTGYIVTRDWEDPLFVTVAAAKKSPEENDDPAVTLEQLLEQRKRFNEKLYKHVRTGELVGMSYHEMAVQRDVLAHNIDAMRRGFPFLLDSSQLIGRFEQFAESISPDVHSAKGLADKVDEIQFQLFERGMFLGYQGKEARTSSILERGMYNCDSSTEFAIMAARYLGIDQQKLLVYEDHLASVVPDDRIRGRMWKVEHTATHGFRQDYARAKQGMIAPVSLFAIGYLLKQGYSLSQFPENIQQYYREKLGSESISTLINKLVGTNTTKAFPSPGVVSGLAPPDPDEIIYMKPMRSGGALADGIGSGDGRFIGQSGNRPVAVARSGAEHVPETAEQKPKSLDSVLGLLDEKRIPSSLLQAVKSTGFYRFLKSHNNDYESRLPKKLLYELAGWSGLSIKGYGQDGMVLLSPDDVRVEQIILKVLQGKVSEAYFGARLKWPSPAKGSFEHRLEQALEEQLAVVEKSGLELFERSIIDELSDARCIKTDKCAEQEYEKAYNLYRSITGVYGIRKVWVSDEEYYHWMTSGVRRIRDEGYVRKLLEQAKRYDRAIYYLMLGAADVLKPEVFEWMRQKYAQKRYDVDHGVMLISLAALGEGSNAWADLLASRLVKYQRPEVSTAIFRALANTGHCQVLKDRGVPYLKDFLENYRESGDIFSVGYVGVKMLNRCRADISELLVHAEQITRDPKAKPDDFADAAYLLGLNLKTQRKALDILLKHYGERKVGLTLEMLKVRDRRYRDLLLEKLESAAEGVKQFNRDAAGRHFRPRRHGRTAADDAFRDRTIEMAWSYLNIARPLLNYFSKDPKVQEISGEHVELLWNSRQAVKDVFVNSGYVGPSRELDKSIRAWLAIALESGHITPSSYQAAQAYANKERLFNRNSRQDLIERCKNLSMAPVSVAEWHVIWPCMDADAFHSRLRLRTASQELFHEYFAKD